MSSPAIRVFISYSHRDEVLREQLVSHLAVLQRQKLIEVWHDRKIDPGEDGDDTIDTNLERSEIILLLVSSDFINSMYCWEKELERSLERHEAGQAVVVPIVVRPVDLQDVPFERIQSLPRDRKPITTWPDRDEAWVDVVRGLRKVIHKIQERKNRAGEARDPKQAGDILKLRSPGIFGNRIDTGYAKLDELLSGLQRGDLIILGSRPSIGKTSLVLNIAMNVAFAAERKNAVGFFSLETSRDQLAMRMVSASSFVNGHNLRSGRISDDDWSRVNGAISLMKHSHVYVEDSATLNTKDLRSRALRLKEEHGLDLLIVDHLQLIAVSEEKSESKRADVSRELREIARELNVPMIVTTQLSRKIDRRTDKRPYLEDLPEGYDLDIYADVVLLLFREDYYDQYSDRVGVADLIVARHRNGPTGEVPLAFLAGLSRFENIRPEKETPLAGDKTAP